MHVHEWVNYPLLSVRLTYGDFPSVAVGVLGGEGEYWTDAVVEGGPEVVEERLLLFLQSLFDAVGHL